MSFCTHVDGNDHSVALKDVDILRPTFDIPVIVCPSVHQLGIKVGVGKPILADALLPDRLLL